MNMQIAVESLLDKADGSVYKLVMIAAKRAIELNAGAGRLIEADLSTKLSTLSLEEIRQGKVRLKLHPKERGKK